MNIIEDVVLSGKVEGVFFSSQVVDIYSPTYNFEI